MMSGKSSKIVKLAHELKNNGETILVIKHSFDNRFSSIDESELLTGKKYIITHDGRKYLAETYSNLESISDDKLNVQHILIDESQFFPDLLEFCSKQKSLGKHLYVAGLAKDFARKSFGQIDELISTLQVDHCQQFFAKCECGAKAIHSFRKLQKTQLILIGGSELYEPVCDTCYDLKSQKKE